MDWTSFGVGFASGFLIMFLFLRWLVIKPLLENNEILEGFVSGILTESEDQ